MSNFSIFSNLCSSFSKCSSSSSPSTQKLGRNMFNGISAILSRHTDTQTLTHSLTHSRQLVHQLSGDFLSGEIDFSSLSHTQRKRERGEFVLSNGDWRQWKKAAAQNEGQSSKPIWRNLLEITERREWLRMTRREVSKWGRLLYLLPASPSAGSVSWRECRHRKGEIGRGQKHRRVVVVVL